MLSNGGGQDSVGVWEGEGGNAQGVESIDVAARKETLRIDERTLLS